MTALTANDIIQVPRSLSARTKLVTAAAKTWRRLKGENQLPKVERIVSAISAPSRPSIEQEKPRSAQGKS
jgi:hypothetical protein